MVKLRDKVRDSVTGYTGVVIARCEYLNGSVLCEVQPEILNKVSGELCEAEWIDEERLGVLPKPTPQPF